MTINKCSLLAIVAITMIVCGLPSRAALIDGVIAGWTFDETSGNFTDSSDNGNTLFAADNPHGNGSNGKVGGALDLDGENDWATSDDGTNLNNTFANFTKTDAFSISLWVNNDNVSEFKSFAGQWSGGDAGKVLGWTLRNGVTREKVWFLTGDGDGNKHDVLTGNVLEADKWQHLVATYDGSGSDLAMEIYVDGERKAQDSTISDFPPSSDINNDNEPFAVGARENSEGGHVDGEIDEVGLWDRVLTDDEVSELYNDGDGISMGTVIPEPTTGLILLLLGGSLALLRPRRPVPATFSACSKP